MNRLNIADVQQVVATAIDGMNVTQTMVSSVLLTILVVPALFYLWRKHTLRKFAVRG